MRRLIVIGLVGALGLGMGGCITPSIPIPPPDPARMTFDVTEGPGSTATFSYPAEANYGSAIVYVYNRDLGVGIIEQARDDGSVGPTQPVAARLDDQIVVTFQLEDQTVGRCIRLRDGIQDPNTYCGP
ncbi:MAG: hypothetical protein M3680_18465 [Myxococcota bacterium]|nr:hypothetical protein [Myxococcota bacterium]